MDQRDRMRAHSCDECGLEFTNHDDYAEHMAREHGVDMRIAGARP